MNYKYYESIKKNNSKTKQNRDNEYDFFFGQKVNLLNNFWVSNF